MHSMSIRVFTHTLFPILIGGLIYLGFRDKSLTMFNWVNHIGLNDAISSFRQECSVYKLEIPNWVVYSLPDGLWTYSFTSSICLIWEKKNKIYWMFFPFIIGVGLEVLQFFNIVSGTFDIVDLAVSLIAFVLSILILKSYKNEKFVT